VILPKPGSITYVPSPSPVSHFDLISRTRLHLPEPLGHPINLTIFKRNTDGALGDQVATTGPYSDTLSGVCITKTKLEAGIYLFIPSTYDKGTEGAWTLNVWSDVGLSAENAK
jgi:calpain-7